MTRRERLMATLRGESVDRPPVNFYEINGREDTASSDPFNIYSHPSWKPLIALAREKTDRIVMCGLPFRREGESSSFWQAMPELQAESRQCLDEQGSLLTVSTVKAGRRILTQRTRRDRDVNTIWTTEHLLKDVEDFQAWLTLPEQDTQGTVDAAPVLEIERELGDSGIVMLDTPDPLCLIAPLFDLGTYTVVAMTETSLFRQALDKMARQLYPKVEAVSKALPGRLWRIYGPEYAAPPYLPPRLFNEYVTPYVTPMVEMIHRHGGFARIHAHGRLRDILHLLCATGCMGLDPIEPPPQGDVDLAYVRRKHGTQLVLFGNLEISDIETLSPAEIEEKVLRALDEGPGGRGFVLMPSAAPYGRSLPSQTLRNYEKIVECVERL